MRLTTLDRKAPAHLYEGPQHRPPFTPGCFGIMSQQSTDDLRRLAEEHGHGARQQRIPEDIPSREATHNRRLERKNHAADPSLPDRKGAHGTGLHDRVERAPPQSLRLESSLGV